MVSVLIPVYNFDVRPLVNELRGQFVQCGAEFEIIIADDHSSDTETESYNSSLAEIPNVKYFSSDKNLGRSKIRNRLADMANFPILLFLDCDARVKNDSYIADYIAFIEENNLLNTDFVISGGLSYRNEKPPKRMMLRYRYGVKREVRTAAERTVNPYKSFTPFNIIVSKQVFGKCRFDESLTMYGYEDTFFGMGLERLKIPVFHIDNQMFHDGLDDNGVYLEKISHSCQNLRKLVSENKIDDIFVANSKLLKTYLTLDSKGWGRALLKINRAMKCCSRFAAEKFNSMIALDLFKLAEISQE